MPATRQPSERGIVCPAAQDIKRVHVPRVVVQISKLDQGVAAETIDQHCTPQLSVTKKITDDLWPVAIVTRRATEHVSFEHLNLRGALRGLAVRAASRRRRGVLGR